MHRFLKRVFGIGEERPRRGDTRVTYWRETMGRKWNFHVQDGNNEIVCQSNQGYETEAACLKGIENARDAFNDAIVVKRELT